MLLDHIKKEHLFLAAEHIDINAAPPRSERTYWVRINNKYYPFKHLIRVANSFAGESDKHLSDFTSKAVYRDYVKSLGFEIVVKKLNKTFIDQKDVLELVTMAGETYNPNDPKLYSIKESLKNNAWDKTQYWASEVAKELGDFSFVCKKMWSQRNYDNGKRVSSFKPYTWAKVFAKGDKDKDIYFTLGIESDSNALIVKLDFQFSGNSKLTDIQKDICQRRIDAIPNSKIEISSSNLVDYDWEMLIEVTSNFIEQHKDSYNNLVNEIWGINQKRLARITYNTNGWTMPSGKYGKSSNPGSHEGKYGYGHEEWLFDFDKTIDGYHYGFLEPIRKEQQSYQGKKYDVGLFTINAISKQRYWIGDIFNVEILTKDEAHLVKMEYEKRGWLKEMEEQIGSSDANQAGFSNWEGLDVFNIRFKDIDAKISDPIPLQPDHAIYEQKRYTFTHFKKEFSLAGDNDENREFSYRQPASISPKTVTVEIKKNSYHLEPRTVQISYLHNAISEGLTQNLRTTHGEANVNPEYNAASGANRIDIVVNSDSGIIFYEIKTYPTLKSSIREAIGQLMEYSFWPDKQNAKELIIVTQPHDDDKKACLYIKHMREKYNLPIFYQSFDINTGLLSEKF